MSVSAIQNLGVPTATDKATSPETLRRTAQQFEAVLLMQLTSLMNTKNDDDGDGEDKLFGGDGGTDLAQKMFSEQMATTMAQSGGIGLSDVIMQQLGAAQSKIPAGRNAMLANAMSAVKDIKTTAPMENLRGENKVFPLINRSAKPAPISKDLAAGDSNDAEIISTAEQELADDNSQYKPLTLDGKILNSTRPRIVPKYALTESETNASSSTISTPDSIKTATAKVNFQMPVSGRISSDFGMRFHPIDHKEKFHGGLDIAVPLGTPVGAAAAGIVKFAGWKGGYGNAVIIEHPDGKETLYGHNEKLLVTEGQQVSAGETISLSGSTGKSTGPHVHFEVRENDVPVNPRKFLTNVLRNTADK